jgi:diguanylate cyclase (GGDEF)-like protein
LLKLVATRISDCIRSSDMPARLGGDEFAVLLDRVSTPDDARMVTGRIIEAIEGVLDVDGNAVQVSSSIGIAFLPAGGLKAPVAADALVRSADEAMYRAKKSTRGQYRFVEVMAWPAGQATGSVGGAERRADKGGATGPDPLSAVV